MLALLEKVRAAVLANRYAIGLHAAMQLDDRGVPDWQVIEGVAAARLIVERPSDKPNPAVEVEQVLPDGTPIKAVWAWLPLNSLAKLVTVHYFDR